MQEKKYVQLEFTHYQPIPPLDTSGRTAASLMAVRLALVPQLAPPGGERGKGIKVAMLSFQAYL